MIIVLIYDHWLVINNHSDTKLHFLRIVKLNYRQEPVTVILISPAVKRLFINQHQS